MTVISASAMDFLVMISLLPTILMNVLMERTRVMRLHKSVKAMLVVSHVNVKLGLENVLIWMNVHLRLLIAMHMLIAVMNLVHSRAYVKMDGGK